MSRRTKAAIVGALFASLPLVVGGALWDWFVGSSQGSRAAFALLGYVAGTFGYSAGAEWADRREIDL